MMDVKYEKKEAFTFIGFHKTIKQEEGYKDVLRFGRRHIVKDSPISFKPNNLKTPWNKQLLIIRLVRLGFVKTKVIVFSTGLLDYTMVEKL